MTCIVGLEADGKVYMGSDSASTDGWKTDITRLPKVFHKGEFLIGATGSRRALQLLQYFLDVRLREDSEDAIQYMVTGFVEAVRKCLKEGGFTKVENEKEEGNTFIVGFDGEVYIVHKKFQVCSNSDGFGAVGCGSEYALGNLWATHGVAPEKRVLMALEAAGHFSNGVSPPYYIECLEGQGRGKNANSENDTK